MEDKKKEVEAEVPVFMVTAAPGFFDGSVLHGPGTKIAWAAPEGWDAKAKGKHWAQHPPSETFRPMNASAEAMLDKIANAKKKK